MASLGTPLGAGGGGGGRKAMSSLQQVRWMVFCDCGTSPKDSLAKMQPPLEPGLCPEEWRWCFLLAACGERRGTEACGRRGTLSGNLAICHPGPMQTVWQWLSAGCLCLWKGPWLLWPQLCPLSDVGIRSKC